jgi:hypothetical protein
MEARRREYNKGPIEDNAHPIPVPDKQAPGSQEHSPGEQVLVAQHIVGKRDNVDISDYGQEE